MKFDEDIDFSEALDNSIELSDWVAEKLCGLRIPELPNQKRLQLSMAFQHLAFEHAQAIVILVDNELVGSALALIRPMFEAIIRGVWLRYSASDEVIENFPKIKFPSPSEMAGNSPQSFSQSDSPPLSSLKERWWKTLCGYTHGGEEQICARLCETGLKESFEKDHVISALRWSEMIHCYSGLEMADAAGNNELAQLLSDRMIAIDSGTDDPKNCGVPK